MAPRRRKKIEPMMTSEQLAKRIADLGFTQQSFARAINVNDRTVRAWVGERSVVPVTVALLVNLMVATDTTAEDLKPVEEVA